MKLTARTLLPIALLSFCLGASAQTPRNGRATVTKSTSHSDSFIDTPETVQVQTWSIQLMAVLDGGVLVYDQTFDAALDDPELQAAIIAARTALTEAAAPEAVAFGVPIRTSLTTTLLDSSKADPLETSRSSEQIWTSSVAIGPADILIGEFGECTGTGPVFEFVNDVPTPINCSGGDPQEHRVMSGDVNTSYNIHTHTEHYRTITTTETYLNRAVYLLAGTTGRSVDVPEPGSLALLTLGACGACLARRRPSLRSAA